MVSPCTLSQTIQITLSNINNKYLLYFTVRIGGPQRPAEIFCIDLGIDTRTEQVLFIGSALS